MQDAIRSRIQAGQDSKPAQTPERSLFQRSPDQAKVDQAKVDQAKVCA
ncbi:hypothetical protein ACPOL_3888 [Acidisarcina polymorpha]|uniref:Uncharacterized protein n=1 Tax=Acidisarcina polymorpha TaxID=2211140 RepID=A0A2Z5G3B7_9BACT|nr:hypothetical protein ACPOL_3888 [Acidisarcina polymorpha]